MSTPFMRNTASRAASRRAKRRPAGVSRRQRRHFQFEALEDRRVMDGAAGDSTGDRSEFLANLESFSYGTSTAEGQLLTLMNELQRYQSNGHVDAPRPFAIPTDPFLGDQWHLINSGQQVGNPNFQDIFATPGEDINVAPVWNAGDGIFGDGVVVAVIDSGVEDTHPDLAANLLADLQFDALELDGDANPRIRPFDPDDPFFYDPSNAHGTAVAGIIAAVANNDLGGTGIAPEAQIVPIRLIDPGAPISNPRDPAVDAFRYRTDVIDITNNSWGNGFGRFLGRATPAEILALRDSVFFGRDGLGVIHVFSSGNDGLQQGSANYRDFVNSRYTIGVTGVDHTGQYNNIDGTTTGYPVTGSSVLVAGPTGSNEQDIVSDGGIGSGIVTTDTTDNSGFNTNPDPDTGQEFDNDFEPDERFATRFNGTSASAPMVSGVIALMLEANPNLSWRDVQEILVRAARQNAKFATQGDGLDRAQGVEYQSTWIVNQVPLFHDPDLWDPAIDPRLQMVNPTLDPNEAFSSIFDLHYAPTPQVLTNGAGYTVSQGRGTNFGENLGWAHGVIDADLAVKLASQWHDKGEVLPAELTFTTELNVPFANNLPAAEIVDVDDSDVDFIVPGGLGGGAGFAAYWQEYFADDPFADNNTFPARGFPVELTLVPENMMSVETMEVTITGTGGTNNFLDNVRVVLVSPNGTHSELNHYYIDPAFAADPDFHQTSDPLSPAIHRLNGFDGVTDETDFLDPSAAQGTPDQGDAFQITFSTNRSWGERGDDAIIFDPTTKEPITSNFGGIVTPNGVFGGGGNLINFQNIWESDVFSQGWQLYFENYGTTAHTVQQIEVAWHGSPIDAQTRRIQGLVGVDDNQDDIFNFSRVIQQQIEIDGNPTINRLGEIQNLIDPDHETMAANVTVTATRVSDGVIVDQFVTGHDGNFYFDLEPGDYRITIDDPLGRTALDDSLTAGGFLQDYRAEWLITEDYFNVWDYDAQFDVPIDPATGAPLAFLDGTGLPIEYHVNHINFLLDPGNVPPDQVEFTGLVFADANGDGAFNTDDIAMPDIAVFADVNRNGFADAGEPIANTELDGSYTLIVETTTAGVIDIGVIPPLDWDITNPPEGVRSFFAVPGERVSNVTFAIQPNASPGDGGTGPGIILGTVFNDANGNAARNPGEGGASNIRVYLDLNRSGVFDAGDRATITNDNGAYVFTEVSPGQYDVRLDIASPFVQTLPFLNRGNTVTVGGAGTAYPVLFGVRNSATLDYGDLPALYGVTLAGENGARHNKGAFFLGARIDAELNGQPTPNADGDDLAGEADEDGITVAQLPRSGGTVSLSATASRHGGYLKAWIDFNDNGSFDDPGERIVFSDPADPAAPATNNWLLDAGANTLEFTAPAVTGSVVYARFRYGEAAIDSVTGLGQIGEVEDYALAIEPPAAVQEDNDAGDFDNNGKVSGLDFLAWQRNVGMTGGATHAHGDATGDGNVDGQDLAMWQGDYAPPPVTATAPATGDYNLDGSVVGDDFLTWQRGVGSDEPSLSTGDGTGDGSVDDDDLLFWEGTYGIGSGPSAFGFASGAAQAFASSVVSIAAAATPLGGNSFVGLAPSEVSDQQRAVDVVLDDIPVEPMRAAAATLELLRRDAGDDDDLFSVTRERAFAEQEGNERTRDEVFARLPQAFYEK